MINGGADCDSASYDSLTGGSADDLFFDGIDAVLHLAPVGTELPLSEIHEGFERG